MRGALLQPAQVPVLVALGKVKLRRSREAFVVGAGAGSWESAAFPPRGKRCLHRLGRRRWEGKGAFWSVLPVVALTVCRERV